RSRVERVEDEWRVDGVVVVEDDVGAIADLRAGGKAGQRPDKVAHAAGATARRVVWKEQAEKRVFREPAGRRVNRSQIYGKSAGGHVESRFDLGDDARGTRSSAEGIQGRPGKERAVCDQQRNARLVMVEAGRNFDELTCAGDFSQLERAQVEILDER